MRSNEMVGKLITFEGIDGCGKSTQARLFYEKLNLHSIDCILTREPGGSIGAEEIRKNNPVIVAKKVQQI